MGTKRKQHSAEFKAQVAKVALAGDKTLAELASEYGVHPTMISTWKRMNLVVTSMHKALYHRMNDLTSAFLAGRPKGSFSPFPSACRVLSSRPAPGR